MFKFVKSSTNKNNWYENIGTEVAFWGRSNVGKSSLINAITNNSKLARTSKTPGRTQLINFFQNEHNAVLVDLPGYGYAKISQAQKEQMMLMIEEYLLNRSQLKNLFLLIDARHGITKIDEQILTFLNINNIPFSLVYTKMDKLKQKDKNMLLKSHKVFKKQFELTNTYFVSSETKSGINDLIDFISIVLQGEETNE
ncbi:ribosome biogenesis GTP-binding protein YihA/YsxC [Mycoplasmopsis sturni]|uniref:ribosome biogenesis GTP-binding protein YihA/YsxC n=1 Tax=Mycoplasmopsis sturni TaxID=39047 RepID=UPI0005630784|nr:ribosome biogenesis GTP-binding protein YihA/YsxC [Mycoplasmopsis sturni]